MALRRPHPQGGIKRKLPSIPVGDDDIYDTYRTP